jgi:heme exporter protein B
MAHGTSGSAGSRHPLAQAGAVLAKDLVIEYRTRFALTAVLLFAVTTLVTVSYTVGQQAGAVLQAALLWIVLYFAALSGLTRTFVAEEDGRTADALRLSAGGVAVFSGKLAFNLLLLVVLAALLVPGFGLLMGLQVAAYGLLVAALATGCWGLAAVLTFTAALVAQARARGALGAVVAFPLVAPLLPMAVGAVAAAITGDPQGWAAVRGLAAYSGIMTVAGVLLFDSIWTA